MLNVGIYIYDDAEVLDFSGPFEVFSTANRMNLEQDAFNVFLIAETKNPVKARGGYSINPHYDINSHPHIDAFIVVGGVHTEELKKTEIIRWVKTTAENASTVASVCTGAFILAKAGLLNQLTVTTHWEDIADLRSSYPELTVLESQRWVDQGKFVTSGGISAGIDMSLHLVSRLTSEEIATGTARQMEYVWHRNE